MMPTVDAVPTPDLWQCPGEPARPERPEVRNEVTGKVTRKRRPAMPAVPCDYRTNSPERRLLGGFAEASCPVHGRGVFLPWS